MRWLEKLANDIQTMTSTAQLKEDTVSMSEKIKRDTIIINAYLKSLLLVVKDTSNLLLENTVITDKYHITKITVPHKSKAQVSEVLRARDRLALNGVFITEDSPYTFKWLNDTEFHVVIFDSPKGFSIYLNGSLSNDIGISLGFMPVDDMDSLKVIVTTEKL